MVNLLSILNIEKCALTLGNQCASLHMDLARTIGACRRRAMFVNGQRRLDKINGFSG